jgi:hypothetical protein
MSIAALNRPIVVRAISPLCTMPRFVIRPVTWSIAFVTVSNDDNEGVSAIQHNRARRAAAVHMG